LAETYFAFSDAVESVGRTTFVRFDALRSSEHDLLVRYRSFEEAERDLHPRLVEFSVALGGAKAFPGLGGRRIETDRWYQLTLGDDGVPASVYDDPGADEPEATFVEDIAFLDGRSDPAKTLSRLVSLNSVPDAAVTSIEAAFSGLPTDEPTHLAVYNVGQGSCAAVCTADNVPIAYVDFGGGVTRNAKTYPASLRFCFTQEPPVVLSHWDLDHWVSGKKHPNALDLTWIAPRQKMGASHLKFATELQRRGKLLIWPTGLATATTGHGTLFKLQKHRDRNYSGLVVVAEVGSPSAKVRVLCPGDAPYHRLPTAAVSGLSGLVATHHGGLYRADSPPAPASTPGAIAYSFGTGNSYKHPHKLAVSRHASGGWTRRRDTPNGHTALPALPTLPLAPACGGIQCSLAIQQ